MPRISNIGLTCSIEECVKPAWSNKLCRMHLSRLRNNGRLTIDYPHTRGVRKFFEDSVLIETDDCIVWRYTKSHAGHGQMALNGRNVPVHRLALERRVGSSANPSHFALHKPLVCHNPSCFNHRHLYWGDQTDNMRDAVIDGTVMKGERSNFAKLTEKQVKEILRDERRNYMIAKDYNISQSTVGNIKKRQSWKHLDALENEA